MAPPLLLSQLSILWIARVLQRLWSLHVRWCCVWLVWFYRAPGIHSARMTMVTLAPMLPRTMLSPASVEDLHPSTAREENETLTDGLDHAFLDVPVSSFDYSPPVIILSPGCGGQAPCDMAPVLFGPPPATILPASIPIDGLSLTTSPPDVGTPAVLEISMTVCSTADCAVSPVRKPVHPVVAAAVWSRRQACRCGSMVSHAKFLQHLYRGYSRLRPSDWVRGGLHGAPMPYRPATIFRCRGGMRLAGPERFAEMRGRSAACD